MQIFNKTPSFRFMAQRRVAMFVSLALIILSIASMSMRGLNLGLDFTGGVLIEVGYPENVDLSALRLSLHQAGYGDAIVQHFGSSKDVMIRVAPRTGVENATVSDNIIKMLAKESNGKAEMRRQEFVGPQVGDELRDDGGIAMLIALGFIMVYVMLRFEWRFALGSIIALIHDVVITLGLFSIFQWDFDLTVLAAVLAIIGYSLNDTIVVFDRIRENFRRLRKKSSMEIIDSSLNQTLSRTLMTSFTTLLVVFAMFLIGGEMIHSFSMALLIGIGVGTYSSIYVASSIVLALNISSKDMMQVEKENLGEEV